MSDKIIDLHQLQVFGLHRHSVLCGIGIDGNGYCLVFRNIIMRQIMDDTDGVEVHTAGVESRGPRVVDDITLRVVIGIFRVDVAHHVDEAYMGDTILVQKLVVLHLVQVKRGTIERAIFTGEVMELCGIDRA